MALVVMLVMVGREAPHEQEIHRASDGGRRALLTECVNNGQAAANKLKHTWAERRNTEQVGVDWPFTTDQARIKLKRPYPQYQAK